MRIPRTATLRLTAVLMLLTMATAQAAPAPPYITANSTDNTFTLSLWAGRTQGTTTIAGDAGSFTGSTLWLSVDGAAETLISRCASACRRAES